MRRFGCPEKSGDTVGLGCKLRLRQKRESVTVEEEEDEGRERKELGKRPKRTELDRIERGRDIRRR